MSNADIQGAPGPTRPWRTPVAILVGLAVGVGLTVVIPRLSASSELSAPIGTDSSPTTSITVPDGAADAPPGAGAASAMAAVEGFLTAESAGDLEASFSFLSRDLRRSYRSPAGWVAGHADVLPPILGYDLGEAIVEEGRATVPASVRFRPSLDEVVGLVPGAADVVWAAVEEGDGWAVDLAASTMTARFPDDDGAAPAVATWAEARQRCDRANERDGTLVGSPAVADGLCDADGTIVVGAAAPLSEIEATPFATAFGGEVIEWARVVPVTAPLQLRAVVAPLGDRWLVIGVLR